MQYKGSNLCDFCFTRIDPGAVCPKCGLTHESYKAESGLLMPGTNLLGKYIIGRVLGRGGFGATYLAYSSERDGVVAIKEYYPTGIANRAIGEEKISIVSEEKKRTFEKGANRFFEEAKTIAKFNSHNNVVSVYEFFYANNTVYYSMEFLEGIDFKGYISKKGGRIPEEEAITVMHEICDALVMVHSTQTLHRDISPDNIFICTNGKIKLIDFGAAKQVIGDSQQVYSVVVKQGFAPPEQYSKSGKQGVWTDIYAIGASIYYAVMGKVPKDALNRVENPEITFDSKIPLSEGFKKIINKCLQSKIADRYQSVIELLADLDELGAQKVSVGGSAYVQTVYNGVTSSLQGNSVNFNHSKHTPSEQTGYNPFANSNNSSYNVNSQNSQYHNSYNQHSQYILKRKAENSGLIKGLIIGVSALIIVALLVVMIVTLTSGPGMQPPQPGGPGMQPPQPGGPGMPPPPGGMGMPPGGPMGMPMQGGGNTGLIVGCVIAIVVMIAVIISTAIFYKKK